MADSVTFTLRDASKKELLSLRFPGAYLLHEELYAKAAVEIVVSHGLYYTIEHRRIHTEAGAGFESHEIVLTILAGGVGGAAGALVQQMAAALQRLASTLASRHDKLSEAEAIEAAIEYAETLDDPPTVAELVIRDAGTRVVELTTATHRIRVELDRYGKLLKIGRRRKRAGRASAD